MRDKKTECRRSLLDVVVDVVKFDTLQEKFLGMFSQQCWHRLEGTMAQLEVFRV